jgi:hypothetical protein
METIEQPWVRILAGLLIMFAATVAMFYNKDYGIAIGAGASLVSAGIVKHFKKEK